MMDIKPCPRCDSNDSTSYYVSGRYAITCDTCGATQPRGWLTLDDAIREWNREAVELEITETRICKRKHT
jgi:hypothetical protein